MKAVGGRLIDAWRNWFSQYKQNENVAYNTSLLLFVVVLQMHKYYTGLSK